MIAQESLNPPDGLMNPLLIFYECKAHKIVSIFPKAYPRTYGDFAAF